MSRRVARALKKSVWGRDKNICHYCRTDLTDASPQERTVDHVIPAWKGGKDVRENLVTCCRTCNLRKEAKERKPIIYNH